MQLITPTAAHLASYVAALERGWSPNNIDSERHRLRELAEIAADPALYLSHMDDREAKAGDVELPDGSFIKRLPGIRRWMWSGDIEDANEGEFCGAIGLRWVDGTEELPPHLLGHIGYAVVPWMRGHGFAAQAVRDILPEVRALNMRWVTITTDKDNPASRRTIENAGGIFLGERQKPVAYDDGKPILWFRVDV